MKVIRTIVTICLLVCWPVAECLGQLVSEWKSVWKITISVKPHDGMPGSIHVSMENRGEEKLIGRNLLLSIDVDETLYCYAKNQNVQKEQIEIPVGDTVKRILSVDQLEFVDLRGEPINASDTLQYLSERSWAIRASLTDLDSPRPAIESSYLIWSNEIVVEGYVREYEE